jgi:hypothetical protein
MGTYLSVVLAFIILRLSHRGRGIQFPPPGTAWVAGALMGAWALDGVNSLIHFITGSAWLYAPSNALRFITGAGNGLALGVILYPIWHYAMWPGTDDRPVLERLRHWLPLLAGGAALIAIVLGWPSAPYALWATAITISAFGVLTGVNALMLALIWPRARTAVRVTDIAPYLALGLVATLGELGVMRLIQWWALGRPNM